MNPPLGNMNPPPDLFALYEARMQEQNQLMMQMQQQMQQMMHERNNPPPRARTIGEADDINEHYQNRSAIVIPPVPIGERRNFELRASTIGLVKQSAFHGLPAENPMRHIEEYEAICDTTQATGANLEFFRCRLFQFSLAGKAEQWLRSLPPGSLTSWNECKAAFLRHFYTKGRTTQLRSKITTFTQLDGESFSEAWERLKEYIRECPHHGFPEEQILRIFYDGVDWTYKIALNSASNGDFNTQSIEGAKELIENMAISFDAKSPEYDRTKKVHSVSTPTLEDIAAQVQELLRMSGTQKEVHMVNEPETGYYQEGTENFAENSEEVSYVNGQGYGQNRGFNYNYRNHPNLSYRSTNVANPQDQIYPPQQGQQNQNKQYTQNQSFQGQQNQGYQGNYGSQYQPKPYNNQGQNSQPQNAQGYAPRVPQQMQNTQGYAPRAPQQMQNAPYPPPQPRTTLEDIKTLFFNGQMEITKAMNEVKGELQSTKNEIESKLDALETRIKMAENQVAQTAENARRQPGTLPGRGENPRKDVCVVAKSPEEEDSDYDKDQQTEQKEERVEKLGDPGPLNLQIEVKGKIFSDCLCDLGASVNVMSYKAAKSIGLHDYEPARMSLTFADSSVKSPLGMVIDLPVKIDKVNVPTDFVILELENDSKETVILGRPFLSTTGVVINAREKSIELNLKPRSEGLKGDKRSIDPGASKLNHLVTPLDTVLQKKKGYASDLGKSIGSAEKPRSGPDKTVNANLHANRVRLEPQTLSRGKAQVALCAGSGSVTRPPDPSRS